MERKGWWFRATTEQRLAQIDAAIELGMTARQVAMNCGCLWEKKKNGAAVPSCESGSTVHGFAYKHGRHFNGESLRKGFYDYIEFQRIHRAQRAIDRTHDIHDQYLSPFQRDETEPFLDEITE